VVVVLVAVVVVPAGVVVANADRRHGHFSDHATGANQHRFERTGMKLIELRDITKTYHLGEIDVPVLKGVSLDVNRGELVALMGASGSGKSTLMNILGGLDRPTSGAYRFEGEEVDEFGDNALGDFRRRRIGFVFQSFHLLPYLCVAENVALPLSLIGVAAAERQSRAALSLESVGLGALGARRPGSLSGGEMQRVAIARALVHRPRLLLADEPTGNLDEGNAGAVLRCLAGEARRTGSATLMVTHSRVAAGAADRVLRLERGRLRAEP